MSLTHLWAPWRMEFIKGKATAGCVFCDLPKQKNDRENLILMRAKDSYIIMNKFPYNNGHLLIVPNAHIAEFPEVPDAVLTEMNHLTKLGIRALERCYKPQGFNVGINLGEAAGAGVKGHVHTHIVPRWSGDTNFMPVVAETKSLPQHIMASFDQIQEELEELQ